GTGFDQMSTAHCRRIQLQLLGDLVQVNFQSITRLWCPVSSLRTTRRLVGKRAQPLKLITRHVIGDSLQGTGVERAGHPVTAVCPAIKIRLEMHPGDGAVILHSRLNVHQDWMASAVAIEDFLARERHLDWSARHHRELTYHHFVIERVALAAKAAAIWRSDYTD